MSSICVSPPQSIPRPPARAPRQQRWPSGCGRPPAPSGPSVGGPGPHGKCKSEVASQTAAEIANTLARLLVHSKVWREFQHPYTHWVPKQNSWHPTCELGDGFFNQGHMACRVRSGESSHTMFEVNVLHQCRLLNNRNSSVDLSTDITESCSNEDFLTCAENALCLCLAKTRIWKTKFPQN